jgi:PEP-CTERM motif-containing protein
LGPPDFSTNQVPTRVNSPSDVELEDRSASAGTLTFTPGVINSTFTAAKSVLNGINPKPNQTTGGDPAVTGQEVQFNVLFSKPFSLPADHYFFVPQVQLSSSGDFFWLSAPRPIVVPPGTSFPTGFADLQEWIRNENLAPDWLRVGTDIVGGSPAPTFNASFSISGNTVPEPTSVIMLALGGVAVLAAIGRARRRHRLPLLH